MQERRKIQLPAWSIILDLFGTLLLALGIYGQFGGGELLFSEFLDLRQYAVILILLGVLLIAPLVVILVKQAVSSE
jgi:hypothetical protein